MIMPVYDDQEPSELEEIESVESNINEKIKVLEKGTSCSSINMIMPMDEEISIVGSKPSLEASIQSDRSD